MAVERWRNDIGPAGDHLRVNLKQLRQTRSLSTIALSKRLSDAGRPIQATGITKIESGDRRVDVGDLVALAVVLGVNPNRLLLPFTTEGTITLPGAGEVDAFTVWHWAEGDRPLAIPPGDDGTALVDFELTSRPKGIRNYRLKAAPQVERALIRAGLARPDPLDPPAPDEGGEHGQRQ